MHEQMNRTWITPDYLAMGEPFTPYEAQKCLDALVDAGVAQVRDGEYRIGDFDAAFDVLAEFGGPERLREIVRPEGYAKAQPGRASH